MPLPNNNLPSSSQQWAREVEKQLASLNQIVTTNRINDVSKDAATDANLVDLSSLLSDRSELLTYSTELDSSQVQSVTFTSGVNNTFDSNTKDLDINISLRSSRKLLINYSTFYKVEATSSTNPLTTSYGFESKIFVNGVIVDSQPMRKLNQVTTLNDVKHDYDSIAMTKLISVPAGNYKISVTMQYSCTPASSGSTMMSTSGDNLIVSVLQ